MVGQWPWGPLEAVHVLTAWDPGAERPGDEVNRQRQASLEAELRTVALGSWPAVGRDPVTGHREEGVAVTGVSEPDVLALAADYGQDAVFRWRPADWSIVACAGARRLALGWSLTRSPALDDPGAAGAD